MFWILRGIIKDKILLKLMQATCLSLNDENRVDVTLLPLFARWYPLWMARECFVAFNSVYNNINLFYAFKILWTSFEIGWNVALKYNDS